MLQTVAAIISGILVDSWQPTIRRDNFSDLRDYYAVMLTWDLQSVEFTLPFQGYKICQGFRAAGSRRGRHAGVLQFELDHVSAVPLESSVCYLLNNAS